MSKINWGRVLAGGVVAAIVTFVVGGVITAIWGKGFQAGMTEFRQGHPYVIPTSAWILVWIFVVNLVVGIVLVWVYAGIRPRYGPGPKTAARAGFALWVLATMADVFLIVAGVLPVRPLVAPMIAALVGYLGGAEAGAWVYKE